MKKILYIVFLFIISCGYQPIYISQNEDNFKFQKITLDGNTEINNRIISSIGIKEDETIIVNKELIINSSLNIEETSKNTKGEVTSYRSRVIVKLIIKEDKQIIKNKNFIQDFTYNKLDNKFDLVEYQDEIKNNIINKIIEEIIIYINL